MKRVVTGHDENGKSVFLESGEPDKVVIAPGIVWREVWATYPDSSVPLNSNYKEGMHAKWQSVYPAKGETRARIVEFDPEKMESTFSAETIATFTKELPGLLEHMEPNNPGMHTTDSMDYGILLKGTMRLELDDGESIELEAGDIVVQNGTRHAWRYISKCTIAWILIGVSRVS